MTTAQVAKSGYEFIIQSSFQQIEIKDSCRKGRGMMWGRFWWCKRPFRFLRRAQPTLTALQTILTIAALVVGACWARYTYTNDKEDRNAREYPTLEVRISAAEKFLSRHKHEQVFAEGWQKDHLIAVYATVKNVGSRITILHLCESRPGEFQTPDSLTNLGRYQMPKRFDGITNPLGRLEPYEACEAILESCFDTSKFDGPLVVSKVSMEGGKMHFDYLGRFFATRPPWNAQEKIGAKNQNTCAVKPRTTNIQEVIRADEMRPQAEDEFEFLVRVSDPGVYAIMFTAPVDSEERERMNEAARRDKRPERKDELRWDAITFLEVGGDKKATDLRQHCDQKLGRVCK